MHWLTDNVIRLLGVIEGDPHRYTEVAPILADGLDDAGYPDAAVLRLLRQSSEVLRGPQLQKIVAGKISEEQDKASREAMTQMASTYRDWRDSRDDDEPVSGKSFEWLMTACNKYVDTGDDTLLGFVPDESFDSDYLWKHYMILTGKLPLRRELDEMDDPSNPPELPGTPFRCSC